MAETIPCDLAIVGGGLAGGLIALAVAQKHPDLRIRLIEGADRFGGNHLWSFFGSDVAKADRWLVAPLVAHGWDSYDITFPAHRRTLRTGYYSIESDRLDRTLRDRLPADALVTGAKVLGASATSVVLADGRRFEASGAIDARGPGDLSTLSLGWQKFVGRELTLAHPHDLARPIVMDATVQQVDGYRFVYSLPFAAETVFVEDTYYSDTPDLDVPRLGARVDAYAAARGWKVTGVAREEAGALPVALGGDFAAYWRSGGNKVAKAGMRAGLFHPTTGYSLPDSVRLAIRIAGQRDFGGAALHDLTHAVARGAWEARGFYRMLDRMLFRAAEPEERYRVLQRFYRLSPTLIRRFYAGRSTMTDKARILVGKPPVPVGRAIAAIRSER